MVTARTKVWRRVVESVRITPNVLAFLSLCADNYVRYAVTFHVATTVATLEQLAQDTNELVRRCAILRLRALGRR